jgi:hypothetical protein
MDLKQKTYVAHHIEFQSSIIKFNHKKTQDIHVSHSNIE